MKTARKIELETSASCTHSRKCASICLAPTSGARPRYLPHVCGRDAARMSTRAASGWRAARPLGGGVALSLRVRRAAASSPQMQSDEPVVWSAVALPRRPLTLTIPRCMTEYEKNWIATCAKLWLW